MNSLKYNLLNYLKLLRIWQWLKNLFIILPILLSKSFSSDLLFSSLQLFFLFSLIVSSNYIFNDIQDKDIDKNHPEKKHRGIASGTINVRDAKILAFVLLSLSTYLTFVNFKIEIIYLYFFYLFLAYIYTNFLKYVNFLDGLCIATFFIIRLTIGGIVSSVRISMYLYIITFSMSIFIIYLKKTSIINKNFPEKNLFYETLIKQNDRFQYKYLLTIFGIASNISFIFWGLSISGTFNSFKILVLILCFLSFSFLTIQLYNESTIGNLEDFVIGVFSNKSILLNIILMLLFFVYIYF